VSKTESRLLQRVIKGSEIFLDASASKLSKLKGMSESATGEDYQARSKRKEDRAGLLCRTEMAKGMTEVYGEREKKHVALAPGGFYILDWELAVPGASDKVRSRARDKVPIIRRLNQSDTSTV
jgi:hypothetical protein